MTPVARVSGCEAREGRRNACRGCVPRVRGLAALLGLRGWSRQAPDSDYCCGVSFTISGPDWLLLVVPLLIASAVVISWGTWLLGLVRPGLKKEFYRHHRRRALAEWSRLIGSATIGIGFSIRGWQLGDSVYSGSGPDWNTILPIAILMVWIAIIGLLDLRARRAGEPTWSAWKAAAAPARPDV